MEKEKMLPKAGRSRMLPIISAALGRQLRTWQRTNPSHNEEVLLWRREVRRTRGTLCWQRELQELKRESHSLRQRSHRVKGPGCPTGASCTWCSSCHPRGPGAPLHPQVPQERHRCTCWVPGLGVACRSD